MAVLGNPQNDVALNLLEVELYPCPHCKRCGVPKGLKSWLTVPPEADVLSLILVPEALVLVPPSSDFPICPSCGRMLPVIRT